METNEDQKVSDQATASTKVAKYSIPSFRAVNCPACGKYRHMKEIMEDETIDEVSLETIEVRGETRYIDICGFCRVKYEKKDEDHFQRSIKELAKARLKGGNSDVTLDL